VGKQRGSGPVLLTLGARDDGDVSKGQKDRNDQAGEGYLKGITARQEGSEKSGRRGDRKGLSLPKSFSFLGKYKETLSKS